MSKLKSWKGLPVTLGLLAAILAGVLTAAAVILSGWDKLEQSIQKPVQLHQKTDVDAAHPSLPKRYVPRTELSNQLHQVDKRLSRMEGIQQSILREVRRSNGRRPRRRRRTP